MVVSNTQVMVIHDLDDVGLPPCLSQPPFGMCNVTMTSHCSRIEDSLWWPVEAQASSSGSSGSAATTATTSVVGSSQVTVTSSSDTVGTAGGKSDASRSASRVLGFCIILAVGSWSRRLQGPKAQGPKASPQGECHGFSSPARDISPNILLKLAGDDIEDWREVPRTISCWTVASCSVSGSVSVLYYSQGCIPSVDPIYSPSRRVLEPSDVILSNLGVSLRSCWAGILRLAV
jgi:hypothetical protein